MNVTKAKAIIGIAFVVTFLAGIAVGLAFKPMPPPPASPGSWLERELDLTKEQREQMKAIWTDVMRDSGRQQSMDRRRQYQKEREDAVRGLLPDDKLPMYEAILQDYTRKTTELNKEREKAFQEAVERTKKILNDEQRRKYEELMKNRFDRDRHRPGGPGGPGGRGGPGGPEKEPGKPAEPPPEPAR